MSEDALRAAQRMQQAAESMHSAASSMNHAAEQITQAVRNLDGSIDSFTHLWHSTIAPDLAALSPQT